MSTGEASLSSFDRNRTAGSGKVHSNRQGDSLAPISKLPVELLLHVFREAIPEEERYTSKRLLQVGGVQARWWDVITDTPELWAYITQEVSFETINTKLMRSQDRPLFIKCRAENENCTATRHFIEQVSDDMHRWKSFEYEGEDFIPLRMHLPYRLTPLLEVLSLKIPPHNDPREFPIIHAVGGPLLRHLYLQGTVPSLFPAVLSNLHTLSMCNLDYHDLLPAHLADLLRACPQLHTLTLTDFEDDRADFEPEDTPPTTIRLPDLQNVHLTDVCHVPSTFLFDSLHLNTGVRFHFSLDDPWEERQDGIDQYEALVSDRMDRPSLLHTITSDPAIARIEVEVLEDSFKILTESSTQATLSSITLATAWDSLAMQMGKLPFRTSDIAVDLKYHTSLWAPNTGALWLLLHSLGNVTSISWNCWVEDCRDMCQFLEKPSGGGAWLCPNLSKIIIAEDFGMNIGRHPWRMVMEYFHDLVMSRREEPTVSDVEVFDHVHSPIHDVKEYPFPG